MLGIQSLNIVLLYFLLFVSVQSSLGILIEEDDIKDWETVQKNQQLYLLEAFLQDLVCFSSFSHPVSNSAPQQP